MVTFDEFAGMVCERFGIEIKEAKELDSFEAMGIDSLSLYSIVSQVESELDIKIETNDITQVDSLSKMYSYICGIAEASDEV